MLDILTELEAILEDLRASDVIGWVSQDPTDRLEMVIRAIQEKEGALAKRPIGPSCPPSATGP